MSTLQIRSGVLQTRLSILFRIANDLELQFDELNKLRHQISQAELSARKSPLTDNGKRKPLDAGESHQDWPSRHRADQPAQSKAA